VANTYIYTTKVKVFQEASLNQHTSWNGPSSKEVQTSGREVHAHVIQKYNDALPQMHCQEIELNVCAS